MPKSFIQLNLGSLIIPFGSMIWLPTGRWSPTDFEYFLKCQKKSPSLSFIRPGKFVKMKKTDVELIDYNWILTSPEKERPLGLCKLQLAKRRRFSIGYVATFSFEEAPAGQDSSSAVSAILNFTFKVLGADKVFYLMGQHAIELDRPEQYAEDKTLHTISLLKCPPIVGISTSSIDRHQWVSSQVAKESDNHLRHIYAKIARSGARGFSDKKKRAFLTRLFNPKIDDPLF